MFTLNEALKIAGLPQKTVDEKAKSIQEAKLAVGLSLNEDFDPQRTQREAQALMKALKDQFNVPVESQTNKDGSISITVNNGQGASETEGNNPHVVTPKNLSKAIDAKFREFRQKGWFFSQPVRNEFFDRCEMNLNREKSLPAIDK
ncbi:hypothetical protein [Acinetobacter sp.]|uniref:hypothetical protein n=1 Tax=Acinetobacter sp. TaxID=472 RepID=UPI00388FF4E5